MSKNRLEDSMHFLEEMPGPFQFLMSDLAHLVKDDQVALLNPTYEGLTREDFTGTPGEMLAIDRKFLVRDYSYLIVDKKIDYLQREDPRIAIGEICISSEGHEEVINLKRDEILCLREKSIFSIKALPGTFILIWGAKLKKATLENSHVDDVRLILYYEDKLDEKQKAEVDAHFAVCRRCKSAYEFTRDTFSNMNSPECKALECKIRKALLGYAARRIFDSIKDLFRSKPKT